MTNYGVVMGQGVVVNDLRNHMLVTGYGASKDKVQSCSAVVLLNTRTRGAGLYHFPEGNINDDHRSKIILMSMISTVDPSEICIAFGTAVVQNAIQGMNVSSGNELSGAMENHSKLSAFMRKEAPDCIVRIMPAHSGVVHVSYDAQGRPVVGIGEPKDGVTDLRAQQEGNYAAYALYGKDLLA